MRALSRGNLKAARKTLRRNRGRSFLTMLGIIIGVASVISVVSIGQGVKQQVAKQINHIGNDLLTVRAGKIDLQTSGLNRLSTNQVSGTLGGRDVSAIRQAARTASVVPLSLIGGTVKSGATVYTAGNVVAAGSNLPSLLNQSLAYGTFFSDDDNGSNVAVLGHTAAIELFGTAVPLGQSFSFRGQTFLVRGVFDSFADLPLSNDIDFNAAIYIPEGTGQQLAAATTPYEILVKPRSLRQAEATAAAIDKALLKTHGDSHDFTILRASDQLAAASDTLDLLTELIAGVAAISLLVGGIGIMNITLVSVTERLHEIGIRKAVGATNRQILNEFLAEAVVLSVAGGVFGIIAAVVVDIGLRVLTNLQPVIQWQIVLLAAGVSIVIGIIFGTAPALKAARKDPIAALRGE